MSIISQTSMTANNVASDDSLLIYDLSSTGLRKTTASDLLNSGIPVKTSSITATDGSDIFVTPNNSQTISGASYVSSDGVNVTVTYNNHGLVVGQIVQITNAGTGYNGTFKISSVTTNTFSYIMPDATLWTNPALCSYSKKNSQLIQGNSVIKSNLSSVK